MNNLNTNLNSTYVPEKAEDKYIHSNTLYVDVIAKDASGIDKVRIHVETQAYNFDNASDSKEVYIVPKFSWSN